MNKNISLIAILVLLCGLSQVSMATVISSNFNENADGWTGTLVEIEYLGTGGNDGGYLLTNDLPFGSDLHAPDKFLGDLSLFNGGTLSFDLNLISSDIAVGGRGGDVTLHSGSEMIRVNVIDITSLTIPSGWISGSIELSATAWGVDQLYWDSVISNITSIDVRVDPSQGANNRDISGFDNFSLQSTAVPAPATLLLFFLGLLGIYISNRPAIKSRDFGGRLFP